MKMKKSFWHSRVVLPLWFLSLAVITIFKPSVGYEVLRTFVIHNEEMIRRRLESRKRKKLQTD